MNPSNSRKGQHVIEYILLVVAVVVVMIAFHHPRGPYKVAVENGILNSSLMFLRNVDSEVRF